MDFLPLFLNIRNKDCLIVGGGIVAHRKASLLLRAGASLRFVSVSFSAEVANLASENHAELITAQFTSKHLHNAVLVIAATDDPAINKLVAETAAQKNLPVNVVDQPDLCSFIMPAIVDRSPLLVAISSSGASPILTRKIKELNETMLPSRIDQLARLLQSYREKVKANIPDFSSRINFWEQLLESDIPELVYSGQEELAIKSLEEKLASADGISKLGEVYLVGAGPGDPDLLTLKALRLMHKADVVLYDRLVSEEIMTKLRPDAEKIHVGKARAEHSMDQESINQLLVRLANEGKKVLRLKGGDPFIFGRGGEELQTLAENKIPFQIVPGITAASGCAAYAGIPLTHRDYAQSVRFLTAHRVTEGQGLDWKSMAREQQTLVFYMGLHELENICLSLIEHGMDKSTPVAVVQQGTTKTQRVLCSELGSLVEMAAEANLKPPTIIIIGEVVRLRADLEWFQPSVK
jgi:uroporphyrin-III C-methyltransferase/precorrin-2 dehydrogenase/sirohydrochlorin ferrochelatase